MNKILLIEPNYKNKYPPIGLMKIAYFHKYILHDYVRFAKGNLPEAMSNTKWDSVYVTSLFTFEWEETIKAIKYALTLVDSPSKVKVGGIAATLLSDQIYHETGIHPICGLLNTPNMLHIPGDECIDQLIPDYSILNDIADKYVYPVRDAYFLSATKGCGMKCGFCAVQSLEPEYVPYLDIKSKIKEINDKFGPKRDLLLMDNNVLRSKCFDNIIDDILECGFQKGASYNNPKTGKEVQRFVDFNQGLDANLLTPEKAKRLGEIALRPARIAFDHIEDKKIYERAVRLCAENGITELSNYILYNSENFNGKGQNYRADTPEDFYDRLRYTLDLQEEINLTLPEERKIKIYSFPMRYIPLSAKERGYVGSEWNPKFLRSVQCMLIPTQGKGVGSKSFFEADFGTDSDSFIRYISMPEKLIAARGKFTKGKRRTSTNKSELKKRQTKWENDQLRLKEWNRLYTLLRDDKGDFIELIRDNKFLPEKLLRLHTDTQKKIYLHYLTEPRILSLLGTIQKNSPTWDVIYNYMTGEFPLIYEGLVSRIAFSEVQQKYMFSNFILFFGDKGIKSILKKLETIDFDADRQMKLWSHICKKTGCASIDFELIRIYRRFIELDAIPNNIHTKARSLIKNSDMIELSKILYEYLSCFREKLYLHVKDENGKQIINHTTELILTSLQTKLFDLTEE